MNKLVTILFTIGLVLVTLLVLVAKPNLHRQIMIVDSNFAFVDEVDDVEKSPKVVQMPQKAEKIEKVEPKVQSKPKQTQTKVVEKTKKNVKTPPIKQDGFSNYIVHGVSILGLEAIRKLEAEKVRSLVIGCAIIFIEFTMNISYFMTEIGGDLQGLLLSFIAASVPTALLIAETYMLSQTKFDIYASDELIAKIDRD